MISGNVRPRILPPMEGENELTSYQVNIIRDRARYLRRYLGLGGEDSFALAAKEWKEKKLHGEPAFCARMVKGIYNISKLG